jgi:hypothetical protein
VCVCVCVCATEMPQQVCRRLTQLERARLLASAQVCRHHRRRYSLLGASTIWWAHLW